MKRLHFYVIYVNILTLLFGTALFAYSVVYLDVGCFGHWLSVRGWTLCYPVISPKETPPEEVDVEKKGKQSVIAIYKEGQDDCCPLYNLRIHAKSPVIPSDREIHPQVSSCVCYYYLKCKNNDV